MISGVRPAPIIALLVLLLGLAAAATAAPPAPPREVRSLAVPGEPRAGVAASGRLWVLVDRGGERRLLAFGPGRPAVRLAVPIATGLPPEGRLQGSSTLRPVITLAGGALWTIDPTTSELLRIGLPDGRVARTGVLARYVAVGPSGLWAVGTPSEFDGVGFRHPLIRIDPATGVVIDRRTVGPGLGAFGPVELAVGRGVLWVALNGGGRRGLAVDLATGAVTSLAGGAWQFFARDGTLLATRRAGCEVTATTTAGQVTLPTSRGLLCAPRDVAIGTDRRIWVAFTRNGPAGRLAVRGPGRSDAPASVPIGRDAVDVVPAGRAAWVLDRAARRITLFR
jgi:hypothetical protein